MSPAGGGAENRKVVLVLWNGERVRGYAPLDQIESPSQGLTVEVEGGGNTRKVVVGPGGYRAVFVIDSFEGTPPTRLFQARRLAFGSLRRALPTMVLLVLIGALSLVGLAVVLSSVLGG